MKCFSTCLLALCCAALSAQTAPNFSITGSDGVVRNLYADYLDQGKAVVIEVFFTSCPPCNTHAPFWQTLYSSQLALHPNKIEFLLLSNLQSDNNAKVAQYKLSKNLSMPGAGADGGALSALQPYLQEQFGEFQGTPTFILIKPDRKVEFDIRGANPQATMNLIATRIAAALSTCHIRTPFGTPVVDVNLAVATANTSFNVMVDSSYSFSAVPQLQNTAYTISPSKAGNAMPGGLSTFDLVLMTKHILSIETLQPWQAAAADMNCSGSVTTFDVVLGRKLILGIDTAVACGTWTFLPKGNNAEANGGCTSFFAVQRGDITGPYFAPPPSDRGTLQLLAADQWLEAGETHTLHLGTDQAVDVLGLQLALKFPHNHLKIRDISSNILPDFDETCQHGNAQGSQRLLWASGQALGIAAGAPLLSIAVQAQKAGWLSDLLALHPADLPAEMYDAEGRSSALGLRWLPAETADTAPKIVPNPARGQCQLRLFAPEARTQRLQMYDLQGRLVLERQVETPAGISWHTLRPEQPLLGMFFLKIDGRSIGTLCLQP
jgi:hypothetical protein